MCPKECPVSSRLSDAIFDDTSPKKHGLISSCVSKSVADSEVSSP